MKKKIVDNKISDSVGRAIDGLLACGAISLETKNEYDAISIEKAHDLTPERIKSIRQREHMTQSVFARYLNASASAVKKWETGEKHPSGIALRMLNLIEKNGLAFLFGKSHTAR